MCRVLIVSLLVAGAAVSFSGAPVGAAADIASGWWWRANPGGALPTPAQAPLLVPLPTTPPPPPAPPNAGAGNLLVAATPDGATSIAAVRASGASGALTLTVAENGGVGAQAAKVLACKISGLWAPVEGGRWDDKPSYSCDSSSSVPGTASADGTTWTFAVSSLVTDDSLDVALVPAPADATTGATAPFQLVFKAPGPEAFGTVSGDTATKEFEFDSGSDFAAAPLDFTAPTDEVLATELDTGFFDPGTSATFTAPAARTPVARTATPVAAVQPAPAAAARLAPPSDDAKHLPLLVVLLAGAAAYGVTRQQVPAIHGLGRVRVRTVGRKAASPTEAGLGRFRKPRSGPPPRLF
jgi:hypothetical protein